MNTYKLSNINVLEVDNQLCFELTINFDDSQRSLDIAIINYPRLSFKYQDRVYALSLDTMIMVDDCSFGVTLMLDNSLNITLFQ